MTSDQIERTRTLSADFGDAVMVLMKSSAWRDAPLRQLEALLIKPMGLGQAVVLRQTQKDGRLAVLGLVLVARVSDAVHESFAAGVEVDYADLDWRSGDRVWFVMVETSPEAAVPAVRIVCDKVFPGQEVWARVKQPDGGTGVIRVAPDGEISNEAAARLQ